MTPPPVTSSEKERVPTEAEYVDTLYSEALAEHKARFVTGIGMTAHVQAVKCIGCDQCLPACKFDALEMVPGDLPKREKDETALKAKIIEFSINSVAGFSVGKPWAAVK